MRLLIGIGSTKFIQRMEKVLNQTVFWLRDYVSKGQAMPEKVLIIDDEHSILRLSQLLLQRKGYDVSVSLSVKEAKNVLAEGTFDLIVLDLMMPEENGFDFLNWKKEQDDQVKTTPVIVNTAKILSDDERNFLETECKKIIPKGIDFTEKLVADVEELFSSN